MKKFIITLTFIAIIAMIATTVVALVALFNLDEDGAYECSIGYGGSAISFFIIATLGGVAIGKINNDEELEEDNELEELEEDNELEELEEDELVF